jgi:hypothetical protein
MCKLDLALRLLGRNWKYFSIGGYLEESSFGGLINGIFLTTKKNLMSS